MNPNRLTDLYGKMTAEQRFRLILAAMGRDDEAERKAIYDQYREKTITLPDHSLPALAFMELANITFMSLCEDGTLFMDATFMAQSTPSTIPDSISDDAPELDPDAYDNDPANIAWQEAMVFGARFRLRVKGWIRFCKQRGIPPFVLWNHLPGFDRFRSRFRMSKLMGFRRIGLMRWMAARNQRKSIRYLRQVISVEHEANQFAQAYQMMLDSWSVPGTPADTEGK